jgi:uncharacterized membrane protein YphA (DoxX/SURF4 family)
MDLLKRLQGYLDSTRKIDFLGPLAFRVFLAPIFILAGLGKLSAIEGTAQYFGFLGIPAPTLMAYAAGLTELVGGILLIPGVAVRWIAVPLMVTMVVAAGTAHWDNGWHALPDQELTMPWEWREDLIDDGVERRTMARTLLRRHGNYDWLTEAGSITILKNGIEFAATYFRLKSEHGLAVQGSGKIAAKLPDIAFEVT